MAFELIIVIYLCQLQAIRRLKPRLRQVTWMRNKSKKLSNTLAKGSGKALKIISRSESYQDISKPRWIRTEVAGTAWSAKISEPTSFIKQKNTSSFSFENFPSCSGKPDLYVTSQK